MIVSILNIRKTKFKPLQGSAPTNTSGTPRLDAPTFQSYTEKNNLVSMLLMAEHEAAYDYYRIIQ